MPIQHASLSLQRTTCAQDRECYRSFKYETAAEGLLPTTQARCTCHVDFISIQTRRRNGKRPGESKKNKGPRIVSTTSIQGSEMGKNGMSGHPSLLLSSRRETKIRGAVHSSRCERCSTSQKRIRYMIYYCR